MKPWAKAFYLSKAWQQCREGYMLSQDGLCERCSNAAEIVHHKVHLTKHNIDDVRITLSWGNLEALCRTCHALEHEGKPLTADGLMFDDMGNLIEGQRNNVRKSATPPPFGENG